MSASIVVIGGGLGGLVSAYRLVQAGFAVTLVDAGDAPGGVIGTVREAGYLQERAASSFLGGPSDGGLALCQELGVAVAKASPAAKRRWVYLDGKLQAIPHSPLAFARTEMLTWRGKLELLREPFRSPRQATRSGDESVYEFAVRRLGAEAARAFVAPMVTGIYAADAREVSLAAGFPTLAALDADGGLLRGGVRRALAPLRRKLQRGDQSTAASASARSGAAPAPRTSRGLWAPVAGVGALPAALAGALGERVWTRARVASVTRVDGKHRIALHDGRTLTADAVVLAVHASAACGLVQQAHPVLASKLSVFSRTPAALVYLGYPRSALPPACHEGFGMLTALGERVRVLGVVFESVVWPERAPEGMALLRCIFGGGRDPSIADVSDAALQQIAIADLQTIAGITAAPVHCAITRWAAGIPRIEVGHNDRVVAADAAARTAGFVLAGADYHGVSVNALCADGARVVAAVRELVAR